MDKKTEDMLLDMSSRYSIARKCSPEETEECPVYDRFEGMWIESDEQLRQRIKKEKNND